MARSDPGVHGLAKRGELAAKTVLKPYFRSVIRCWVYTAQLIRKRKKEEKNAQHWIAVVERPCTDVVTRVEKKKKE